MANSMTDLRSVLQQIRAYVQHKPECEMSRAVARPWPSEKFGRSYMKRVNGKIAHRWDHVCGSQGFGMDLSDTCPGCDNEADERDPICTCRLDTVCQQLDALLASGEAPEVGTNLV